MPQLFQILKMDRAPRQHRGVASRRSGRDAVPRNAPRWSPSLQEKHDRRRRGQEHHRLWRLRGFGAASTACCMSPTSLGAAFRTTRPEVLSDGPDRALCRSSRFNARNPAHQPGHEAARRPIPGKASPPSIRWAPQFKGKGHQRHRLRRLRGTGAGRRRPGPCQRDERGSRRTLAPRASWSTPGHRRGRGMVLEVDSSTSAASRLASSRPSENPVGTASGDANHPIGSTIEGEMRKSITEFGLFIGHGFRGYRRHGAPVRHLSWSKSAGEDCRWRRPMKRAPWFVKGQGAGH